ncbi:MAG TPA: hypothetical protein VMJ13_02790 [Candidatus Acidoferrum sp.]|nr:hypothetical protein [Candidatus Acidoferrum sp.]
MSSSVALLIRRTLLLIVGRGRELERRCVGGSAISPFEKQLRNAAPNFGFNPFVNNIAKLLTQIGDRIQAAKLKGFEARVGCCTQVIQDGIGTIGL